MVAIKLREAIQRYKRRTRERMTYEILAERTGLAKGTLNNMGSRHGYNATLATIEKICLALDVTPMLFRVPLASPVRSAKIS